jgi:uncharacterized membrane-anchored protein
MTRPALVAAVLLAVSTAARAQPRETAEEFERKLGYETGVITLSGGMATLRLPSSFRFLGTEGSKRLLVDAWDNPKGSADNVLGMLIPAAISPLSPHGWGIVITYDEDGYVNDSDAAGIDYTKLLTEMQESAASTNERRKQQGYAPVTLVGWAEPPSYDKTAHKLYWAKELSFGGSTTHTLNYNIRILGRRGVLVLNAVSGMDQLATIRTEAQTVLPAVEFNEGHRYADYLPGKDKAATYGVVGLIAGATAAKAGLFKGLIAVLIAAKKAIVVGVMALIAAIKRLFGRGKPEEETSAT